MSRLIPIHFLARFFASNADLNHIPPNPVPTLTLTLIHPSLPPLLTRPSFASPLSLVAPQRLESKLGGLSRLSVSASASLSASASGSGSGSSEETGGNEQQAAAVATAMGYFAKHWDR